MHGKAGRLLALAGLGLGATGMGGGAAAQTATAVSAADLGRLSIEELATLEITSVSKKPQPLNEAPASVFVITDADVRSTGALRLPEALRLAPNLHVGRYDTLGYAITARGFNGYENANKLLVLIDGRTVYTPLHSGVFWDTQDVMLEDLQRVEVVSGPGGTLWGTNAVNGVINVTTKSAHDTQGALGSVSLGTDEKSANARFGGRFGDAGAYRVYAMGFDRRRPGFTTPRDVEDDWEGLQGGFRWDWDGAADDLTLQGDIYKSTADIEPGGGAATVDFFLRGHNVLGRWGHAFADGSRIEVQGYYDWVDRYAITGDETVETYDVQFQHVFSPWQGHEIVWGAGHRFIHDNFINFFGGFVLDPQRRRLNLSHLFVQDEIALTDRLDLTVGLKAERSGFSGMEYMPNARLGWRATETDFLWAAVSRVARTPSRIDRELVFPGVLEPGDIQSEKVTALEGGYRGSPLSNLTLSVSLYYNFYDDIRSTERSAGNRLPLRFLNGIEGETYGLEAWGDLAVAENWRLGFGVNLLEKDFRVKPGRTDTANLSSTGNDPSYQFQLRSVYDFMPGLTLDARVRFVDDLPRPAIASYVAVDAKLGWRVTDALELSVTGINLTDARHSEVGPPPERRELRRAVQVGARWSF